MLSFKDLSDYYDLSEEEIAVILFCLDNARADHTPAPQRSELALGLNPHSSNPARHIATWAKG